MAASVPQNQPFFHTGRGVALGARAATSESGAGAGLVAGGGVAGRGGAVVATAAGGCGATGFLVAGAAAGSPSSANGFFQSLLLAPAALALGPRPRFSAIARRSLTTHASASARCGATRDGSRSR